MVTPLFVGPVLCGAMPYGIGWSSAARVSKESGQGMSPVGTLSEHRSRARRSWGETMMELDSESRVAVGDPRWRLLYGGMCLALSTGLAGALLVAIAGASWTSGFLWFLYLLAATAVAAIIGLIFGLPRTLSGFQPSPTERYKGNSNLEEISDWLTKLLVGVGLVQLAAVPGQLVQLSDYLSKDMDLPNASSYVSAAIVYGASVGSSSPTCGRASDCATCSSSVTDKQVGRLGIGRRSWLPITSRRPRFPPRLPTVRECASTPRRFEWLRARRFYAPVWQGILHRSCGWTIALRTTQVSSRRCAIWALLLIKLSQRLTGWIGSLGEHIVWRSRTWVA